RAGLAAQPLRWHDRAIEDISNRLSAFLPFAQRYVLLDEAQVREGGRGATQFFQGSGQAPEMMANVVAQSERVVRCPAAAPGVAVMFLDGAAALRQRGKQIGHAAKEPGVALEDARHRAERPAPQVLQLGELTVHLEHAQAERWADLVQLGDIGVEVLARLDEMIERVANVAPGRRR